MNLEQLLQQYEKNTTKQEKKVYDLKNYFTPILSKNETTKKFNIRILPVNEGTPFVEMYGHKIKVDDQWKTFPCLKHTNDEPCPFCEARQLLLSTGDEKDKEIAKKYSARLMYVVKVIDRDNEDEGVKFWRFNHDYRKTGTFDKIVSIIQDLSEDITSAQTGRDLRITVTRDQNGNPVISNITYSDKKLLTSDETKLNTWLSDERTWKDVYSIKPYEFMEIIVKGGTPVWDKGQGKFVDKNETYLEQDQTEDEVTLGKPTVNDLVTQPSGDDDDNSSDEDDDLPF